MSNRPSTSKARGVCSFFQLRRGCRNGESCKFIHGEGETLSPYDKGKICKFYTAGFCKHEDRCWFRHPGSSSAAPEVTTGVESSTDPILETVEDEDTICSICQEKPITYGLLDCSHIFCLKCIRGWRIKTGKSLDIVESGNTKKCPYCRAPSKFVTPSSIFYRTGDPMKVATVAKYRDSMARIQCKFFDKSPPGAWRCPFGRDCFYQHKKPDGSIHVFSEGSDYYMNLSNRLNQSRDAILSELFPNVEPTENGVLQTLTELRSRFQAMHQSASGDTPDNGSSEESFLSRLVEDVLISLEDSLIGTVTAPGTSEDDHIQDRHSSSSRPSIFATPEDSANTSALPLTRAFMEFNALLDNNESLIMDEDSTSHVGSNEDLSAQTVLPQRGGLIDLTNLWAALIPQTNDARNDVDEDLTSNIGDIEAFGVELSSSERSYSPVNDELEHVLSEPISDAQPGETEQPISLEPPISPTSLSELPSTPTDINEIRPLLSTDITDTKDDLQSDHDDSRSKSEALSELSPRRTKSSTGSGSCSIRRNGGQSFFTDGRGRVVGTDDGVYTEAGSLAFWAPGPLVAVSPPTSMDHTNIIASGDHGSIDDMD